MAVKVPKSKVELHLHLDGALRIQTIIELAKKKNFKLPAYDLESLRPHVSISLDRPSSLSGFLACFRVFLPVIIDDLDAIERIAFELCEDQAAIGVLYFEARYSPHLLCTGHAGGDISVRAVVQAVNRGLDRGQTEFGVKARTILCCIRPFPDWSLEVVALCREFATDGVVGIDLAGDESFGEIPAMKGHAIAFEEARSCNIHRTVHAGEAGPAASVKEALDVLHAERIGHGYHVLEDKMLYNRVLDEGIHIEVCPTSSILTGAVKTGFANHPIRRFAEDGANFSLNSDDPLICQTTVDLEQGVAFNNLGLGIAEITSATFNAAKASFLPLKEKQQLIDELKIVHGIY